MKRLLKGSLTVLLAALLAGACLSVGTSAAGGFTIRNPYQNVDWAAHKAYRAQLHTHTTASDGADTLAQAVEAYYGMGYDLLSITDHSVIDRGWVKPNYRPVAQSKKEKPIAGLAKARLDQIAAGQGRIDARGMVRVPLGIELTANKMIHVNSWFCDWGSNYPVNDYDVCVKNVNRKGGLCMINHAGSAYDHKNIPVADLYTTQNTDFVWKTQRLIEKYPALLGFEIPSVRDRKLWDIVLKNVSPTGRNVFGIATSDAHSLENIDKGWVWAMMPANTEGNLKASLKTGAFFAGSHATSPDVLSELYEEMGVQLDYQPVYDEQLDEILMAAPPSTPEPMITDIAVAGDTITITAVNHSAVRWISDGKVVAPGAAIDLEANRAALGAYVRAEVYGPGGILYTQPFLLTYDGMPARTPVPADYKDPGEVTFWQQLQYPFFWMLNQLWCMARGIIGK